MICPGCNGIIGRDCYNPDECQAIARDKAAFYDAMPQGEHGPPDQGLSEEIDRLRTQRDRAVKALRLMVDANCGLSWDSRKAVDAEAEARAVLAEMEGP